MPFVELAAGDIRFSQIQAGQGDLQCGALLDHCFGVPIGSHFFDDFPVWNPQFKVPSVFMLGAFQGERLVSCAGIRMAVARMDVRKKKRTALVPMAILGAVATVPEMRGKGIASQVVSRLLKECEKRSARFVALWGGEHSLYRKLGFELCGYQARVPLPSFVGKGRGVIQAPVQIFEGWNPKLFDLIRSRTDGVVLEEEDRSWYEGHLNVQWFYTGSPENPKAFVALGRGIDLSNLVHEWGGPKEEVASILSKLCMKDPRIEILSSQRHCAELGGSFNHGNPEFLCMAKILNPQGLLRDCYPQESTRVSFKEGLWQIHVGTYQNEKLNDQQLVQLFFGPNQVPLKSALLPVDLWFWGLDAA